ncbi:MAG: branched-chain amino acid ABC transporter permease, partial [Thermodesulfobacteriota bacterium]|nr:branched-chain amino acid ABC transporter permease [Thermodesulfobacteriota bacterium]
YTTAILVSRFNLPIFFTLPASGVVALVGGLIVGLPCLRLKGLYLAMATMCSGFIIQFILTHWVSLTKGVDGIPVSPPSLFGYQLNSMEKMYFLILGTTILFTAFASNTVRTKLGRAFIAIRDRDIAAEIIGVNLTKYKMLAFLISSFYAGVAGSLYSYYYMYVHVEAFSFEVSLRYLCMIICGGMGSIAGSIMGAVFIAMVPDGIKLAADTLGKFFPVIIEKYNDEWTVAAFGLLIILFLIIEPGGLFRIWKRVKTCFVNWPFTY